MIPSVKKLVDYITKPLYLRKPSGTIALPKTAPAAAVSYPMTVSIATGVTTPDGSVMDFIDGVVVGLTMHGGSTVCERCSVPATVPVIGGRIEFELLRSAAALSIDSSAGISIGSAADASVTLALNDGRDLSAISIATPVIDA